MSKRITVGDTYSTRFDVVDNEEAIFSCRMPDGRVILGYLTPDGDVENPLTSCDGSGRIYTTSNHASKTDYEEYQKARGMNSDWERDKSLKPDPYHVLLDCYKHSMEIWAISGSEQSRNWPDQQWDVGHGVGVWVPDDPCREHIEAKFKTMKARKKEAVRCCEQALKEYNAWLSGECFCVVIEEFTSPESPCVSFDIVGGYIGFEWAVEGIKEQMAPYWKEAGQTKE